MAITLRVPVYSSDIQLELEVEAEAGLVPEEASKGSLRSFWFFLRIKRLIL